ncbi:uncharacterized protein HD556DRAFT_1422979 [Suillus plorans]|uniref:Protein kinase domain-containing protein n=1 Tax=Suillus plorans TaxID=116603 RepID=A0A9P7DAU3_9AGAM|nr:uncharacterized protein HD556DRAFT_1422979 [Suillus plorans]KAG1785388.1 hypothetical protein HD556DRAFT_1422979 [Suillus plorans]
MAFFALFDSKLRAQRKEEEAENSRLEYERTCRLLGAKITFPGDLDSDEVWWRDHFLWLKDAGYQLRPRHAPDWVPSWRGTDKYWGLCEDSWQMAATQIASATRTSDGAQVVLKRTQQSLHPYEVEVGRFLTSEPLRRQRENHCVEMLDVLQVPNEVDETILVLPLLRPFDDPPFETIGEIIDFALQVFEGLQFMHKHHVAHRDCMNLNIMMDPRQMYPHPFHPCNPSERLDLKGWAKHRPRTEYPPRYLFIDFGISRRYQAWQVAPLEPPIWGGYKGVPEFQMSNEPRNPFPTDVWYLGFALQQQLLEVYRGLSFMEPLVSDMLQTDPAKRPTMDEVMSRFVPTYSALSPWKLRSRAVKKEEWIIMRPFRALFHWLRCLRFLWRRLPAIPSLTV